MASIEFFAETKTVYEPLISKKWWKVIRILFISIILFSYIFESQFTLPRYFSNITFPNFENYQTSIQLTVLILIILIVLTLSDLAYRKYRHINDTNNQHG